MSLGTWMIDDAVSELVRQIKKIQINFFDVDILPATGALISVESLPAFPPRMRKSDFGSRKIIILP